MDRYSSRNVDFPGGHFAEYIMLDLVSALILKYSMIMDR